MRVVIVCLCVCCYAIINVCLFHCVLFVLRVVTVVVWDKRKQANTKANVYSKITRVACLFGGLCCLFSVCLRCVVAVCVFVVCGCFVVVVLLLLLWMVLLLGQTARLNKSQT